MKILYRWRTLCRTKQAISMISLHTLKRIAMGYIIWTPWREGVLSKWFDASTVGARGWFYMFDIGKGIPSLMGLYSGDNLTNKSKIQAMIQYVLFWAYHHISINHLPITQLYYHYYEM